LKRSEINAFIDQSIEFFADKKFPLPDFAYWSPADWQKKGAEYDEIRDLGIGWDITDFSRGEFIKTGRIIFTLRNGSIKDKRHSKPYAQKAMCLLEGQKYPPVHYHKTKMEDIINHGGGNILVSLLHTGQAGLSDEPFDVSVSGVRTHIRAGELIRLKPGDSLTIEPFMYHRFWAEEGQGRVLSMEVSTICDDYTDNFFLNSDGIERFPETLEDEPPRYLRVNEYESVKH
jgi:D-lyxose ketol-isomerase